MRRYLSTLACSGLLSITALYGAPAFASSIPGSSPDIAATAGLQSAALLRNLGDPGGGDRDGGGGSHGMGSGGSHGMGGHGMNGHGMNGFHGDHRFAHGDRFRNNNGAPSLGLVSATLTTVPAILDIIRGISGVGRPVA